MKITRRDFVKTAGSATVASLVLGDKVMAAAKRRYAIVGTGERAIGMWGRPLLSEYSDLIEFVGLCDINHKRVEVAKKMLGVSSPTFTDFDRMCEQTKPDLLMVTTVDGFHSQYITRALDRGIDVIDRKSTRLNSSHRSLSRMPSSA